MITLSIIHHVFQRHAFTYAGADDAAAVVVCSQFGNVTQNGIMHVDLALEYAHHV